MVQASHDKCLLNSQSVALEQGGSTPDVDRFVEACVALCGPSTQCFIALEQRSTCVMEAFFSKATDAVFHVVSLQRLLQLMCNIFIV